MTKMTKNLSGREYVKWSGQLGENTEQPLLRLLAMTYLEELNKVALRKGIEEKDINGFKTSMGSLAKQMKVSKRTIKIWLQHLEWVGAIKVKNNGKEGIRVWVLPKIIFDGQEGYAHFVDKPLK